MDQDSSSKKKYISNAVKVALSLSFFFGVIYYLFLQNPERISEDLLDIDTDKYKFIIFSIIFGGWAYVSRGVRWIILIEALGYKTSRINSISAVSVGYFASFAAKLLTTTFQVSFTLRIQYSIFSR